MRTRGATGSRRRRRRTPQVYAATAEAFVAQMLNLDVLQAISFEKGCYTGQEVIARAHYRGRVKRRMQRFVTAAAAAAPLRPGDAGTLADGRQFKVVDAATLPDGRIAFLAVAPLSAGAVDDEPALPMGTDASGGRISRRHGRRRRRAAGRGDAAPALRAARLIAGPRGRLTGR